VTWALKALMRQGWRRGVLGGNSAWVVAGGVALVGHLARRAMVRDEDVVWSGELRPGQLLTVFHEPEA
jgi:hypothetical protein